MPDPKDNTKSTGDTHDPSIEPELPAEGTKPEQQPRSGGSAAGEIKDKEAETSNSYGDTRDSGERPQ